RVLFEDRGIAQSFGTIELGDDLAAVVQADLVDAVFVAVEREQVAVAAESERLDGGENEIRRQIRVRSVVDLSHDAYDLRWRARGSMGGRKNGVSVRFDQRAA